ncbi:uncharacterized protein [Gossypium hirsutum]|uniref:RNase H type-1 domain-containing protein n=1 Tax=Gossypium hirsutum TaxID=3635 RepID=A0A1U8IAM1_GOSHI|nr:uncharacterized protein LOC107894502 [Gossypium hirsutum]
MGIRAAIERKVKVLEVYGDSALIIYQLKGEWETRDPKLIDYRKMVLELVKEFDDITFCYLPRDENQMADALATLASMIKKKMKESSNKFSTSLRFSGRDQLKQRSKKDPIPSVASVGNVEITNRTKCK